MSSQFSGEPALIEANLPTAVAIASTTNATPIVVTTAIAHGLETGDYLSVFGAADPAANGTWRAGAVTATTVALTTHPGGANSIGTAVGGAVGTVQQASFGTTIQIPSDADAPTAASVNVGFEALGDRTAWLEFCNQYLAYIRRNGVLKTDVSLQMGASDQFTKITNATNATPIVVTTAVAHNLATGDQVVIGSVGGNTNANGTWIATVTGATTLFLYGSAGNGAYTTGGTLTHQPQIRYYEATRTITRTITTAASDVGLVSIGAFSDYVFPPSGTGVYTALNSAAAPAEVQRLFFEIDSNVCPQGSNLESAAVAFIPNVGAHAAVPANLPRVALYRIDMRDGTQTGLGFAPDPNSANVAAYEVFTTLSCNFTAGTLVDRSRFRYVVIFETESGANAKPATQVYGATCTYSTRTREQF